LGTFFFQLWNAEDERRIDELESIQNPTSEQEEELKQLYKKYEKYGGEAIMEAKGYIPREIPHIEILKTVVKNCTGVELPKHVERRLIQDQEIENRTGKSLR
jgi:hypothetical protein